MIKILIADDDRDIRESTAAILEQDGYQVFTAENGITAVQTLRKNHCQIALVDIQMPGIDGIEAVKQMKQEFPATIAIIMTAFGTTESAVKALEAGAYTFLEKPCYDEIIPVVQNAVSAYNLVEKVSDSAPLISAGPDREFISSSDKILKTFHTIHRVIESDSTILILGETGTGKGLLAEAIHKNSPRKNEPFVSINCGAIPENLLESELFGHEKGAFTGAQALRKGKFEAAGRGTVFLDEIGELPTQLQVKFLHVLQEKVFERIGGNNQQKMNARIIAATNKNLKTSVENNQFREDLYYRLNVMPITLPPLRERPEDILLIAERFIERFCVKRGIAQKKFSQVAKDILKKYTWPGNIRELENACEHAGVMSVTATIMPTDLPAHILSFLSPAQSELSAVQNALSEHAASEAGNIAELPMQSISGAVDEYEKTLLEKALLEHHGNIEKTARAIEMESRTLHRKIKKYGIDVSRFRV